MDSAADVLALEFEALKKDLLTAYEASGMKASGAWGKSLEVKAAGNSAQLLGYGYIEGGKPGTPPPSEAIEQWLIDKGIAARLEKDITISSLAFLIARKIGREGWKPKDGSVIERVVTPERIEQIIERVGAALLPDFLADIINHIKTVAA